MQTAQILWFLVIGTAMGTLSGLLGVGGGLVAVPMMLYCAGMDVRMAMGTSLAVIVPVALAGGIKQYLQDHVDLHAAICIAVTGIVFAYVGAYLNNKISTDWLQRIFGGLMIVMGIKMFFK